MGTMPKCTSWMGHKFVGRYSAEPAVVQAGVPISIAVDSLSSIYERFRRKTYERDICVRCGVTVEKNTAPEMAETQAKSTT